MIRSPSRAANLTRAGSGRNELLLGIAMSRLYEELIHKQVINRTQLKISSNRKRDVNRDTLFR